MGARQLLRAGSFLQIPLDLDHSLRKFLGLILGNRVGRALRPDQFLVRGCADLLIVLLGQPRRRIEIISAREEVDQHLNHWDGHD